MRSYPIARHSETVCVRLFLSCHLGAAPPRRYENTDIAEIIGIERIVMKSHVALGAALLLSASLLSGGAVLAKAKPSGDVAIVASHSQARKNKGPRPEGLSGTPRRSRRHGARS